MIKVIKFNKTKFNFKKVVDNYFYKKFKVTSKNLHKIKNKKYSNFNNLNHIKKSIYKLKQNYFDIKKIKTRFDQRFYKIDNFFKLDANNKDKNLINFI